MSAAFYRLPIIVLVDPELDIYIDVRHFISVIRVEESVEDSPWNYRSEILLEAGKKSISVFSYSEPKYVVQEINYALKLYVNDNSQD